MISTKQEVFSQ